MEATETPDAQAAEANLRRPYAVNGHGEPSGEAFDHLIASIRAVAQAEILEQLASELELKSERLGDDDQCAHGAKIGLVTAITDMARTAKHLREAAQSSPAGSLPEPQSRGILDDHAEPRSGAPAIDPQAVAAVEEWMRYKAGTLGLHWKNAKPIIETYFAAAPRQNLLLATIKLPKNPDHNPRAKVTAPCQVSEHCTDSTGEHHTVAVCSAEEVALLRERFGHITRVETVRVLPEQAIRVHQQPVLDSTALEAACAAHAGMSLEEWEKVPERRWKLEQREEVRDAVRQYLHSALVP